MNDVAIAARLRVLWQVFVGRSVAYFPSSTRTPTQAPRSGPGPRKRGSSNAGPKISAASPSNPKVSYSTSNKFSTLDCWADGSNGYLKESLVVARMEAAGFEFLSGSGINANDKDKPTEEDFVWRLPPTLTGSDDDPDLRAQMQAIGESNRMTLLFQKPE